MSIRAPIAIQADFSEERFSKESLPMKCLLVLAAAHDCDRGAGRSAQLVLE